MSTAELFVELRVEELPAGMIRPALDGLKAGLLGLIEGVSHGEVRVFATPRRLAVAIADVADARPSTEREVTGPPADKAFAPDGTPLPTAIAFAKGKGADPADLRVVDLPKRGKVLAVTVREGGEKVVDLVRDGLAKLVTSVPFGKAMVWGSGTLQFGRPLHGIVTLYGGTVIAGEAFGLVAGNTTLGHRQTPGPIVVTSCDQWLTSLRAHHVEPDLDVRAARIRTILDEAAAELGADRIGEAELLEEVTHLVEWPMKVIGTFDEDLLELPSKLLITSMKVNQRYFPVHVGGKLTSKFVVVSNSPFGNPDLIAEGNARVLRARFYDARFFFAEDRKVPLAARADKLVSMRWIRGLGTMADKQARLASSGATVAALVGANADAVRRAAALCKLDLASLMVGEFPDLQGHMGRLYAAGEGESAAVAGAIEDHYLPRGAGDAVPTAPESVALALADRLDTLVGCFAVGLEPKGGGDPQGLRRAAGGVVSLVLSAGLRVDLRDLFEAGRDAYVHTVDPTDADAAARFDKWIAAKVTGALSGQLVEFTLARFRAARVADGVAPDVVDAVLSVRGTGAVDLVSVDRAVTALARVAASPEFPAIMLTVKRVLNISDGLVAARPAAESLTEPAERDLLAALDAAAGQVDVAVDAVDYDAALRALVSLHAPVATFFDALMVNDPDDAIRTRRQGLVRAVADVFGRVADFSRITSR